MPRNLAMLLVICLELGKAGRILERLGDRIVADDLETVVIALRAANRPLMHRLERGSLAFRGRRFEPAGLPTKDDADPGDGAVNLRRHLLDDVAFVEEDVRHPRR